MVMEELRMNDCFNEPSEALQRGLSLIELMTTLALMAITLLLASPYLGDWQKNQSIRGTAETLQSAIQTARAEAIARNRPVSFWLVTPSAASPNDIDNSCALTNSSSAWAISVNNPQNKCLATPSATQDPMLLEARAGSRNVAVQAFMSSGNPANVIRFDSFGRVVDGTQGSGPIARIEIKTPSDMASSQQADQFRSLRLMISSSGATRLCDPALPPTGTDPRRCIAP